MTIELGDGDALVGLLILTAVFAVLAMIELRRARAADRTNAQQHRALWRFVGRQAFAGASLALAVAVAFAAPWPVTLSVLILSAAAGVAVAARLSYRSWLGKRTSSRATRRQYLGHQLRRLQRLYASADGNHEHLVPPALPQPWRGRAIAIGCVVGTFLLVSLLSEVRAMTSVPDDAEFTSTLITKIATVWAGSLIICATPVVFLTWVVVAGLLQGRPSVRMILRRASDAIGSCTAFGLLAGALVVCWNVAGFADAAVTPSTAVDWILDLSIGGVVVGFGVAHFTTLDQISRSTPNRIDGWVGTLAAVYLIALITTTRISPERVALVLIEGATGGTVIPGGPRAVEATDQADWQVVLAELKAELAAGLPSGAAYAFWLTVVLALVFLASFRSWLRHRDRFAVPVEPGLAASTATVPQRAVAVAAVVIMYLAFATGVGSQESRWEALDTGLLFVAIVGVFALAIVGITAGVARLAIRRSRTPAVVRRSAAILGIVAMCVLLPTVAVTLGRRASETDLRDWGGSTAFRIVGWLIIVLTVAGVARFLRRRAGDQDSSDARP